MSILNIYNWKDYAAFRALQGKAIPTHYAWDLSRRGGTCFENITYNKNVINVTFVTSAAEKVPTAAKAKQRKEKELCPRLRQDKDSVAS